MLSSKIDLDLVCDVVGHWSRAAHGASDFQEILFFDAVCCQLRLLRHKRKHADTMLALLSRVAELEVVYAGLSIACTGNGVERTLRLHQCIQCKQSLQYEALELPPAAQMRTLHSSTVLKTPCSRKG